jgi:hypothetical protein
MTPNNYPELTVAKVISTSFSLTPEFVATNLASYVLFKVPAHTLSEALSEGTTLKFKGSNYKAILHRCSLADLLALPKNTKVAVSFRKPIDTNLEQVVLISTTKQPQKDRN